MQAINDRLLSIPVPDFEPYIRPEGAYLVGEGPVVSTSSLYTPDVNFYPNPATNELTISRTTTGINQIQIISAAGTKVIGKLWDDESLKTQLDLSNLSPGIYFIKLSNDKNQSVTQKIIVFK